MRTRIDRDDAQDGRFVGTEGNDRFVGRFGNEDRDIFSGRGGNDLFLGNGGNDVFRLNEGGNDRIIASSADDSLARVRHFEAGEGAGDQIDFSDFTGFGFDDLIIRETNSGVRVSLEDSQVHLLRGVDASDLSEDDFIFAPPDREVDPDTGATVLTVDDAEIDDGDGQGVAFATIRGTNRDDLISGSSETADIIFGRGGDDVIRDVGSVIGDGDIATTGGGRDIIVASEITDQGIIASEEDGASDIRGLVSADDFRPDRDAFDFSEVSGVDSFDDIFIGDAVETLSGGDPDAAAFIDTVFSGLFEGEPSSNFSIVQADNSTQFFISDAVAEQLTEENFIFDEDAVV